LILGAIQIAQRTTRLRVTEVDGRLSRRLLDRPHRVSAELRNCDRLTALLMAEVEAARDAGAERIEVTAVPELRGSRLLRLLDRVSRAAGSGPIVVPGRSETLAAAFLGVTTPIEVAPVSGDPARAADGTRTVAVAFVGESFVGIATGAPGSRPEWVGTRPLGTAALTGKARFSDPPRPNQIQAALAGACRAVDSLSPPDFDAAFVATSAAAVVERLCGSRIDEQAARGGIDRILGQTADDTAAWFGAEPATARLLPATLVACRALAGRVAMPLSPAAFDPVAGRWWLAQHSAAAGSRGQP
jgi:hypothetical protein